MKELKRCQTFFQYEFFCFFFKKLYNAIFSGNILAKIDGFTTVASPCTEIFARYWVYLVYIFYR